ncbi:MAG: LysM peptidoglycan-binding domain-containing protein [Chloroflexi bacterium]|nr:LysM peptidoglycan-binding domain-containing protein [Chloroflexota bacterium]
MRQAFTLLLICTFLLTACEQSTTVTPYPTVDPFVQGGGSSLPLQPVDAGPISTRTPGPTPTRASLSVTVRPRDPNAPLVTPTPDAPRALPTLRQDAEQYVVQPGDALGSIAQRYGVSLEELMQNNNLADPNLLTVGMTLDIPAPDPGSVGPAFKVIPDSELVYGPASALFDVDGFVQGKGGYLSAYAQDVNGEFLTGAEIVTLVAENYSVNPRLLLALIEHQSGWLSNPQPVVSDYPLGLVDAYRPGLYRQLAWAANELNRGFYWWRAGAVSAWVLADGSVVPADATINAGTAGVQRLFSQLDAYDGWQTDVTLNGLFKTYYLLFGNPFDLSIEPLVPPGLTQPRFTLPFGRGETWSFTGGPHGGWDTGSAWAAVDFAPPGETAGCASNDAWVTAIADGLIVRASNGAVIQDLDGDGYEQTGWVVFYMHIEIRERVEPGTYVSAGDLIGHPSCEGGVSNGTHVHLARKYNGEWIAADGSLPFNLDGWISSGTGNEYDGYFTRGSEQLEAWNGVDQVNQITR